MVSSISVAHDFPPASRSNYGPGETHPPTSHPLPARTDIKDALHYQREVSQPYFGDVIGP